MGAETPNDIDRAEIEAHAQHTAEQIALRKVRRALDSIEEEDQRQRRVLRNVLIICAILIALAVWFAWGLVAGGDMPRQPPMQIPEKVQPKP